MIVSAAADWAPAISKAAAPEELVTKPADDYVANFTRDVAREKLLTVASVMAAPADGRALSDNAVRQSDKVADVARLIIDRELPVPVADDDGRVVGAVSRAQILDVLFSEEPESRG